MRLPKLHLVVSHILAVIASFLIGMASSWVWSMVSRSPDGLSIPMRIVMIFLVLIIHVVPQVLVVSAITFAGMSRSMGSSWWKKGGWTPFLWLHTKVMGILFCFYIAFDLLGVYIQDAFLLVWALIGFIFLNVLYFYFLKSRIVVFTAHRPGKYARLVISAHWVILAILLVMLYYLVPVSFGLPISLILTCAVVAFDTQSLLD